MTASTSSSRSSGKHGRERTCWLAAQAGAAWIAARSWNLDVEHARRNLDRIDWP